MARFGQVLFSGSRFIFWALSPFLLFLVIVVTVSQHSWTPQSIAIVAGLDLCAILLTFALYDPKRFRWAGRAAAGIVFIAYCLYLLDRGLAGKKWVPTRRSEESPWNSLAGLIVIGLPCLRFLVLGRFGRKHEITYKDSASETLARHFGSCTECGQCLDGHEYTIAGSVVAAEEDRSIVADFLSKARAHQWQELCRFREWSGRKDNLEAFVVQCKLRGRLLVIHCPFELFAAQTLVLVEEVPPDENERDPGPRR